MSDFIGYRNLSFRMFNDNVNNFKTICLIPYILLYQVVIPYFVVKTVIWYFTFVFYHIQ